MCSNAVNEPRFSITKGGMEKKRRSSSTSDTRWHLHGKTALITGGTKGIGKAIVEELAQLGASVYTCARSGNDLKECLQAWKDAGLGVQGSVCDVSSLEACKQLMDTVSECFSGKLNILVNNAGVLLSGPSAHLPHEDISTLLRTNFESCFTLSQLAHPLLKASADGNIVFNSSIAGSFPLHSHCTIYSSTKAALNQLTKGLACEWAKDGIRVNAVAPGFIASGYNENVQQLNDRLKMEERIPLGRIGRPEDISAAVAFLCMPCSSFTTGHIFTIDGGMTAHSYYLACPATHVMEEDTN